MNTESRASIGSLGFWRTLRLLLGAARRRAARRSPRRTPSIPRYRLVSAWKLIVKGNSSCRDISLKRSVGSNEGERISQKKRLKNVLKAFVALKPEIAPVK
jgi:hypothetical protein